MTVMMNTLFDNSAGVRIGDRSGSDVNSDRCAAGYAVDLGTTSVTVRRYINGAMVGELTFPNPQSPFGADILSRIAACPAALAEQRRLMLDALGSAVSALGGRGGNASRAGNGVGVSDADGGLSGGSDSDGVLSGGSNSDSGLYGESDSDSGLPGESDSDSGLSGGSNSDSVLSGESDSDGGLHGGSDSDGGLHGGSNADGVLSGESTLSGTPPCRMTVSGNTAMLHILAGADPSPLGHTPFKPRWSGVLRLTENRTESGSGTPASDTKPGLPDGIGELILLPFSSAFIGADVISGLLALEASGVILSDGIRQSVTPPYLLADLGTNAELALVTGSDTHILCASAAAGPAFEGGGIECGSGAKDGAVDRVWLENDRLCLTTIGGAPAVTLCGSGLTDAVALLLRQGLLTPEGNFTVPGGICGGNSPQGAGTAPSEGNFSGICGSDSPQGAGTAPSVLSQRLRDNRFYLTDRLYISQHDIRQLQTAKSAIRSGISLLLDRAGLSPEMLSALYLAGGLGSYIDPDAAVTLGLLPRCRIVPVGNTSLEGASLCLDGKMLTRADRLRSRCRTVMLGGVPSFSREFIKNMNFYSERNE